MIFSRTRIIGLCCTVATLVGAVFILLEIGSDGDLNRLGSLWKANTLLYLFLLYVCHFLAEPGRWQVYSLSPLMGVPQHNRNFTKIFACFNITALLSYSLPFKLGLPLRMLLLRHSLLVESTKVIKLMVMDSIFLLLSWTAVSILLFSLLPEITDFLLAQLNLWLVLLVVLMASGAVYWFVKVKKAQLLMILGSISLSAATLVTITFIADILFYGVRHMVLADALELNVVGGKVFIIGILATFAGIISALPMGLGAYDATLVALLGLYGVDIEIGLILALSNRLGMIITSIVLGVPSALVLLKNQTTQVEN